MKSVAFRITGVLIVHVFPVSTPAPSGQFVYPVDLALLTLDAGSLCKAFVFECLKPFKLLQHCATLTREDLVIYQ